MTVIVDESQGADLDDIMIVSRNYTPFRPDKELDEEALRSSLRRFLKHNIVVFLASGGSGEANSLSPGEVRRVFEIGVDELSGKIPVYANLPEVVTAREAIEYANMAIAAGVDSVNLYGPAGLHGFKPTDLELSTYFDEVLAAVAFPVILAPNPAMGYTPSAAVMADLCNRHEHVEAVNLVGIAGDSYFLQMQDRLRRDVRLNVPLPGSLQMFAGGAAGLICNLSNLVPRTVREYVDLYQAGELNAAARVYAGLQRLARFVEGGSWHGPRWQKAALALFQLPGGQGGVRLPYVVPEGPELDAFTAGLVGLGLAEIDELARAAGLQVA